MPVTPVALAHADDLADFIAASPSSYHAAAEVARRLDGPLVLAAGDSLLDQSMLETADLAFRPAHGELDDEGFTIDTLTVTERRGILAGEELLRLMTAAAVRGR